MARFSSREFLIAFIASVVGIVKLFISVDDAIVGQVTAVVLAVVPAVVYILVRSKEKQKALTNPAAPPDLERKP